MSQKVTWKDVDGNLTPIVDGVEVAWAPQAGSQEAFLSCPIYEVLYEGTRGPGKTDALLMDFGQHVGPDNRTPSQIEKGVPQVTGWGSEWKGILFRQTFPQLSDVIQKSKKWFPQIWPGAKYNETKNFWRWPTGETLLFRHIKRVEDYWNYHGHAYPWMAFEELTTWPDPGPYLKMFSCSRSTQPGMPRKVRATTNPYGPGHNWVKERFRLPVAPGRMCTPIIDNARGDDGELEPPRVAIRGHINENRILLHADPGYVKRIRASARNAAELAAWLDGSWDIVAGGMFDDVWKPKHNVIPNIPFLSIPRGWRLNRSYDHGSSKPFSVGWWAESNGEPIEIEGQLLGTVRGDLFRIAEWYGSTGKPNEGVRMLSSAIARGILDREDDWGLKGRVKAGPADSSIFDQYEPNRSVAGDMQRVGVRWHKVDKGPGSRKQGWEQIRAMLKAAVPPLGNPREEPGLFICERCFDFLRTMPVLPRSEKDPDDADTDAEDHIADEVRYRVRTKPKQVTQRGWRRKR